MSENTEPFVVDVERVGKVELHGTGPWSVHEYGRGSFEIVDSALKPARPTVWQKIPHHSSGGTRPASNVQWANKSVPSTIVAAANAALAAGK